MLINTNNTELQRSEIYQSKQKRKIASATLLHKTTR